MSVPADLLDPEPIYWPRYDPAVVIMGDSRSFLAYDFPFIKNSIYNLGVGNSTTRGIISRLYRLDSIPHKYVFLTTGINDWQIPIEEFFMNLATIAAYINNIDGICIITEQGLHPVQATVQPELVAYGIGMQKIPGSYYLPVGYLPADYIDTIAHFNLSGYNKLANAMIKHFHGHKKVIVS